MVAAVLVSRRQKGLGAVAGQFHQVGDLAAAGLDAVAPLRDDLLQGVVTERKSRSPDVSSRLVRNGTATTERPAALTLAPRSARRLRACWATQAPSAG